MTVDFSAPELSSLGGLALVREYERASCSIIECIESCIDDPRFEPMVVHSQAEMLRQRIYQIMAGFWKHQQRVVVKIEVNRLGTNIRYVVTDFKGQRSSFIYSVCYCDRGRMELMIAERLM